MTERTRNEIEGDYVVLQERPKRTSAVVEWQECDLGRLCGASRRTSSGLTRRSIYQEGSRRGDGPSRRQGREHGGAIRITRVFVAIPMRRSNWVD